MVSSSSSIPSGFLGIWIDASANNNACIAKEYAHLNGRQVRVGLLYASRKNYGTVVGSMGIGL